MNEPTIAERREQLAAIGWTFTHGPLPPGERERLLEALDEKDEKAPMSPLEAARVLSRLFPQ